MRGCSSPCWASSILTRQTETRSSWSRCLHWRAWLSATITRWAHSSKGWSTWSSSILIYILKAWAAVLHLILPLSRSARLWSPSRQRSARSLLNRGCVKCQPVLVSEVTREDLVRERILQLQAMHIAVNSQWVVPQVEEQPITVRHTVASWISNPWALRLRAPSRWTRTSSRNERFH